MIQVTIFGRLLETPELTHTASGKDKTSFKVACSKRYKRDGEWDGPETVLPVVLWGGIAVRAIESQTLTEGVNVIVTGELAKREFEYQGEQRSMWEVTGSHVGPDVTRSPEVRVKAGKVAVDEPPF